MLFVSLEEERVIIGEYSACLLRFPSPAGDHTRQNVSVFFSNVHILCLSVIQITIVSWRSCSSPLRSALRLVYDSILEVEAL